MDRDLTPAECRRFLKDIGDGDDVDRISWLPDDILVQILSYLQTKEAVATSILSKRWEYLWTLTPDLHLSDQFGYVEPYKFAMKSRLFKEHMDRVILYHGSSTIRKCYLHCNQTDLRQYIYEWVCADIACKASSLRAQELPRRLFTCNTLSTLKIDGKFVLDIPNSICFPCLKILRLKKVVYVHDASAQNLFSSCPVLEDLAITRRGWERDGIKTMKLSIPSLKRFSINYRGNSCMTEINASSLEYLKHKGKLRDDYSANFKCSLVEARIFDGCVFGLVDAISGVQNLTLTDEVMWELKNIIKYHDLPLFHNLKKLELYVEKPFDWDALSKLLECSPKLEVMNFPDGLVVPKESGQEYYRFNWHRPDKVAECLQMNLKKVEIFNFVGLPGEMYLVAYLLERGEVLEKMIINSVDSSARPKMGKKMEGIKNLVLSFERSSSACEVVFNL